MKAMLAAEDYHLTVTTGRGGSIQLTVAAGPGACSYCLVPKSTLKSIALDRLSSAGLPGDPEIEILCPDDAPQH